MNAVIEKIKNLPKSLLILLSFVFATILYWQSLNGPPIFDDFHFIFRDEVIVGDYLYSTIWSNFAWPLSVSVHKFLFSIWHYEFLYYHLLNLGLHFFNSYLLLKLAEKLNLPFPKFIFLLFLIHPSNVISVSWMVQLKTLLCFTFAILSFLALLKALENKKWYVLSWISFALSIISKSASLPLAVVFGFYVFKKAGPKASLWVLPILLMCGYSTYKVLKSPVTAVGVTQLESKSFVAGISEKSEAVPPAPRIRREKHRRQPQPQPKPEEPSKFKESVVTFLKTSHYYFWQVVLPMESYPVKGQAPKEIGITDGIHLLFLIVMLVANWGSLVGLCLLAGYLVMTPFLGIVPAPFMNMTWVSEQHLYLSLPFFLCLWLSLLSKWKFKYAPYALAIFIVFFSIQTYKAASYYKDEIIFYTKSLQASPSNIPIAYNLASSYVQKNEAEKALVVTGTVIEMSQTNREMKESKYLPKILELHGRLVKFVLQKP
jgi:hypothetical protein